MLQNFDIPFFEPTMATFAFVGLLAMILVQLFYLFFIYSRFTFYRKKKKVDWSHPMEKSVSVVICARDEEENLMNNLHTILEQDYPNFEVIVVNHMSNDNTNDVLRAFSMEYPNLHVVTVNSSPHLTVGKKFPLSLGIKVAKNELLVLTDADCKPTSYNWLKSIVKNYLDNETEIVLGYGPLRKEKGFVNWFSRMETSYIALNYFSFALAKLPYMGVGRNLSYTKKLYDEVEGFKDHFSVISGDDDLFVQQAATRKNVAIEISPESWCVSDAKKSWKDWLTQKCRHYTASPHYKVIKKLLLGINNLTYLLALILCITLLFDDEYGSWALVITFGFFLVRWLIFTLNFNQLKEVKMAIAFPFWELIYLFIIPFVYFFDDKKEQRWK